MTDSDELTSRLKFGGALARRRATTKRVAALLWTQKFQLVDRSILAAALKVSRSVADDLVTTLLRADLIREIRVTSCPTPILLLTKAGARFAAHYEDQVAEDFGISRPKETAAIHEPSRLNLRQATHDLLTQHLVLSLTRLEHLFSFYQGVWSGPEIRADGYALGRGLADGTVASGKLPDAFIRCLDGAWTAVELQETFESKEIVHRKLCQYSESIHRQEIDRVIIGSTSEGVLKSIHEVLVENRNVNWRYADKRWHRINDLNWSPTQVLMGGVKLQLFNLAALKRCYYLRIASAQAMPALRQIELYDPSQRPRRGRRGAV